MACFRLQATGGPRRNAIATPALEPATAGGDFRNAMQDPAYYRLMAAQAKRLADAVHQSDVQQVLRRLARDMDEIAIDLENGAIEIVHPDRLPQRHHRGR